MNYYAIEISVHESVSFFIIVSESPMKKFVYLLCFHSHFKLFNLNLNILINPIDHRYQFNGMRITNDHWSLSLNLYPVEKFSKITEKKGIDCIMIVPLIVSFICDEINTFSDEVHYSLFVLHVYMFWPIY